MTSAGALDYVANHPEPLVVKASGLAAGKGAVVCETRTEDPRPRCGRCSATGHFGEAGRIVVIETFLRGEEVSVLAITDGSEVQLLPVSQDHKRLLEGDAGPTPAGWARTARCRWRHPELLERARGEVLLPALRELRRRGTPFTGVLYAGLMVDDAGTPWVVEFNCRLGDPETQVVLPLVCGGLTRWLSGRWRGAIRHAARAAAGRGLGDDGARLPRVSRTPRKKGRRSRSPTGCLLESPSFTPAPFGMPTVCCAPMAGGYST